MVTARYLQATSDWLIDVINWRFVPAHKREDPCGVVVPMYLWNYVNECGNRVVPVNKGNGQVVYTELLKSDEIELNDLTVRFSNGYRSASIDFKNPADGRKVLIDLGCSPEASGSFNLNGYRTRGMRGMAYRITIHSHTQVVFVKFDDVYAGVQDFISIPGLGRFGDGSPCAANWNYGISPSTYELRYKGKVLEARSLALLCGSWAVLLDEELRFSAYVLLKRAKPYFLDIEHIIYTTSRYYTKVMVLK